METAEEDPFVMLDRLVKALSEMTKPLGYGVTVAANCCSLILYRLSDPLKKRVAVLCVVIGEADDRRGAAEKLLDKYESRTSHTAIFYESYDGVSFPGGSVEEVELKAAAGWTARLERDL